MTAALAPLIAGTTAGTMGWRYGMWVPGGVALAVASVILFTIQDDPKSAGFDDLEKCARPSSVPACRVCRQLSA